MYLLLNMVEWLNNKKDLMMFKIQYIEEMKN